MECKAVIKDGRACWNAIRKSERLRCGCRPARHSAVKKDSGELTQGPAEVLKRWQQHCNTMLTLQSNFDAQVLEQLLEVQPLLDLDETPIEDELFTALSKAKKGKG